MSLSIPNLDNIRYIDFHTHIHKDDDRVINLFSLELEDLELLKDQKFFSIGLHPWGLPEDLNQLDKDIANLEKALTNTQVCAIGECGLDRLRGPDMEIQKSYFTEISKLATETGLPLIVHCVRCFPEIISIKNKFARDSVWIIHGFNAKLTVFEQLLNHGCFISLGQAALKRNDLIDYLKVNMAALATICLETDDSAVTIEEIYHTVAELLDISVEALSSQMKKNFIAIFKG